MSAPFQVGNTLELAAEKAMRKAADYLTCLQERDGHWCAELTADTTLESDYILFQLWLYPPVNGKWTPDTRPLIEKAVVSILERQLPDGGFNIYAGGPAEVSASVKAYLALKLAGVSIDSDRMRMLRERILALGGIQAANSYVKVNLSLFDLYPTGILPEHSSRSRACCPSICSTRCRPGRARLSSRFPLCTPPIRGLPTPAGFTLDELWLPGVSPAFHRDPSVFTWHNFFLSVDKLLKWWERNGSKAIRQRAVEKARNWMVERLHHSDGLGAIYPPMMYSVMALDVLGFAKDDPLRVDALRQFNNLMVDDGDRFFFQPCFSPVWDTAIGAYALALAEPKHESLTPAADWLLDKEIRRKGDWSIKRPNTEPSGWAFEYCNEYYPDIDDTAMVMLALSEVRASNPAAQKAAERRGLDWLLAMQSSDGGWAAFDADNNWEFLSQVPFADHNAMLDPTCADITGRVLEALAAHGLDSGHKAVRRGMDWLIKHQEPDGSWYGRWGVAYIYGTCFALRGLAAAGENDREAHILRAGEWLRSIQNADGGWGESCPSYDNAHFHRPGPARRRRPRGRFWV